MSLGYEQRCIYNIPFFVNSNGSLFNGDLSRQPIHIGTYDEKSDSINLFGDWEERLKPSLDNWRSNLVQYDRSKGIPKEGYKKQRINRRNTRKPVNGKAAAESSTTSV